MFGPPNRTRKERTDEADVEEGGNVDPRFVEGPFDRCKVERSRLSVVLGHASSRQLVLLGAEVPGLSRGRESREEQEAYKSNRERDDAVSVKEIQDMSVGVKGQGAVRVFGIAHDEEPSPACHAADTGEVLIRCSLQISTKHASHAISHEPTSVGF